MTTTGWDGSETTRVQITLRGQRFESTVGTLSSFCTLFRTFFGNTEGAVEQREDSKCALIRSFKEGMTVPLRDVAYRDGTWFIDFTVRKDEDPTEELIRNELQPEFAGALFVYMRKLYAAGFGVPLAKERSISDVTRQEALDKGVRWASRWQEMGYEQQRGLSAVINAFGLEVLRREGFGTPSAEPAASVAAAEEENAEVDGAAAMALQYAANKQREAIMGDDLLEMPSQGCAKCGTSGHETSACPY